MLKIIEKLYKILVDNSEGKRPLGRPRHRLEDNIKMDQLIIYQILKKDSAHNNYVNM
jgi:hypothetical protein